MDTTAANIETSLIQPNLQVEVINVPFAQRSYPAVFRDFLNNTPYPRSLHWTPYEEFWAPPPSTQDSQPRHVRLFSDFHTSPTFINADAELQAATDAAPPGCTLPRAVFAWAEMSDGTQLANFSDTKATPAYAMCLNQSNRLRLKLLARSVETTHFFPEVWNPSA